MARFASCLGAVPSGPRQVLVLRAGAGAADPLGRQAVARRLDTTVQRVARSERRGLRSLRAAAADGCGGSAPAAANGTAAAPPAGGSSTGGGASQPAERTGSVGVQDAFATAPAPDAKPSTPRAPQGDPVATGGDDDSAGLVPLLLAAFLAGFVAVWYVQRRGGAHPA